MFQTPPTSLTSLTACLDDDGHLAGQSGFPPMNNELNDISYVVTGRHYSWQVLSSRLPLTHAIVDDQWSYMVTSGLVSFASIPMGQLYPSISDSESFIRRLPNLHTEFWQAHIDS